MDAKPFLVLDFADLDDTLLPELAKLTKESFNLDSVISAAGELKYIGQLKNALGAPDAYVSVSGAVEAAPVQSENSEPVDVGGEIVTTEEEIEGYRIVRAIVCGEVPASRVVARDAKTYYGMLLDDNNRKPIARLWLNRSKKYLSVFDENKVETRIPIAGVEDIYLHADHLRKTVVRYLTRPPQVDTEAVDETVLSA